MVSVCLPTKSAGPDFARHLRAWREQRLGEEVELVVVDSGSQDATVATARELGARVFTIPPQEFNHGETRNLLARQARGDLLVFTVQDACPADDSVLAELIRPLRQQSELAAVTGQQIPRADADPLARWEVHYHNSVVNSGPPLKRLSASERSLSGGFLRRLRGVAFDNVCSALRRRVWEEFPFARVEYGEDLDWAVRVLRAGHAFLRNPAARVQHSHNLQPYQRLKRTFVARRAANRILEMPPAFVPLGEEEVLSGIGAYLAAVADLGGRLPVAPEPVQRLRLPTTSVHWLRRGLRRIPVRGLQQRAQGLGRHFVADHLCGSFNGVMRMLLGFHGSLSPADARQVTMQLGAQTLGDFLGDYAHAAESAGALPDWLEELASSLGRGV